ncbi:hypothetical protein F5879DRAFT_927582 [Lentinula edodes]|nr:hypothetical protein F5879DRAFT_927582 [Lentinula edodes]
MATEKLDYRRFVVADSSLRAQPPTSDPQLQSFPVVPTTAPDTAQEDTSSDLSSRATFRSLLAPRISFQFCGSMVIALVSAIIGVYSSSLQSRFAPRFSFIACAILNLIWAVFMNEPFPRCDADGFHVFCGNCPMMSMTFSPHTAVGSCFEAPDFALGPDGAIVLALTSPTFFERLSPYEGHRSVQQDQFYAATPPLAVIEEDVRIGRCWKFAGGAGYVAIKMATPVHVTNISIHYPNHRELTPWRRQEVPKIIRLWALLPPEMDGSLVPHRSTSWELFDQTGLFVKPSALGEASTFIQGAIISYDVSKGTKQTFPADLPTQFLTTIVVVEVLDNWGSNVSTCLHRIAIHGEETWPEVST